MGRAGKTEDDDDDGDIGDGAVRHKKPRYFSAFRIGSTMHTRTHTHRVKLRVEWLFSLCLCAGKVIEQ